MTTPQVLLSLTLLLAVKGTHGKPAPLADYDYYSISSLFPDPGTGYGYGTGYGAGNIGGYGGGNGGGGPGYGYASAYAVGYGK